MNQDTKIYVAGHRGLVGSAIVRNLENKGFRAIITRTSAELDLRDSAAVEAFFESEKPEVVFLAAAHVGGIVANNTYRGEFIYDNLMIQNNVIHQAYKNGVEKLLFLGSTCIYPKECPQPMKEEYLLTGPLEFTNEPYAIAKIAGMKLCESYNLQYGTNFISVMPTNLYGPNDNFDLEKSHVLPALIRKIHLGKLLAASDWDGIRQNLTHLPPKGFSDSNSQEELSECLGRFGISRDSAGEVFVEIWGSGRPMREFLWSEDMADACVFLMDNKNFEDLKPAEGPVRNTHINIGTGIDISIADLAVKIKDATGFTGKFRFDASKPDGTMKKLTDVNKLHSLGWKHRVSLDQGIERMYKWYLESLSVGATS